MPCGHVISTDSMTDFLRSLISERKYEIRCPGRKSDNTDCLREWDYQLCRKIGVLTNVECATFEEGLALNYIMLVEGC